MSNCGGCNASSTSGCTCFFTSNDTAVLTGNGRSYAGFNFRPTNVPLPRPYGRLHRTGSEQVIPAGNVTAVVFNQEFSTFEGGMTNIAASSTRLTAPADGYYLAAGYITSNNSADRLFIVKNNATVLEGQTGAAVGDRSTMTFINMTAGEYLELFVATSSQITIKHTDVYPLGFGQFETCYPHFWGQWVRPL